MGLLWHKAIYKNNLLVIPTKKNDDVFLMNYSFDKGIRGIFQIKQ